MDHSITPFFIPTKNHHESIVLAFVGDMLLTLEATIQLPSKEELARLGKPLHTYDIAKSERHTFSLHLWEENTLVPESLQKTNLRSVLSNVPEELFEPLNRAKQLVHWLQDNQFCGRCASPLAYSPMMSSLKCTQCGYMTFPKLCPASIVLITRGDEILLARSPHFAQGVYSLIAGFVEAGESAEACAIREAKEEVGITIKNLRYFATQSWSFPHSLMIGFFAEYESGELCLQEDEIEDAKWFTKETMPQPPYSTSIAYRMIQAWKEGRSH
ncbi:MAG: NAD(+) diphosphatase [Sulfurospirillaceae bacterium]|nr:NAD(+) diphosphatase [Sulfurospirillaceae bacterium]MDD2825709.1 NAD(+) diphosphatase [Sulfurospirillaceae bacterium]